MVSGIKDRQTGLCMCGGWSGSRPSGGASGLWMGKDRGFTVWQVGRAGWQAGVRMKISGCGGLRRGSWSGLCKGMKMMFVHW